MNWAFTEAARMLEIVGVNIVLSGDNAIAVAMAIRRLPYDRRKIASIAGISAALVAQTALTLTLASLLEFPVISLAGGITLGFIAVRLLQEKGDAEEVIGDHRSRGLYHSIAIVTGAYLVMCLDNIVAIASIGRGHPVLLTLGIMLSGAVLVPASLVIANLMRRYPVTLKFGAGLLGWTAGSMIASVLGLLIEMLSGRGSQLLIPAMMAALVVTSPSWWRPRTRGPQPG
jgi:YjbE family integral membrane protein